MNKFRLDLILEAVLNSLGPIWALVTFSIVLYAVFGRTMRATLLVICVLVCTQIWWGPLQIISRNLRWILLTILCLRGLMLAWRTPAPAWESKTARRLVTALGALAVMSGLWADDHWFSFYVGLTFCVGLVVTFGLLWRLADSPDVMEHFARGALVMALVLFGGGFVVVAVSYATASWEFYNATHFGDVAGRYSGLFYNPNAAGLIATMLLPIVVAAPRRALASLEWLRLPTCGMMAATIFLSGSRSALIGAAIALVLLALYRFGFGAVMVIAVGGALAVLFVVANPIDDIDQSSVAHIARTKHLSTLSGRVELWEEGWREAQGHMTLGRGWSSSRILGADIDTEEALEQGGMRNALNLHNAHLQLLIDLGVVGVSLFWAFCLTVVAAGWRILTAPKEATNAIGVVIFASVLTMLADTWVHGSIWSMGSPTTLAFWGLCVLTIKQGDRARAMSEAAQAQRTAWRRPVAAPLPA
jgi:hypothetical protein